MFIGLEPVRDKDSTEKFRKRIMYSRTKILVSAIFQIMNFRVLRTETENGERQELTDSEKEKGEGKGPKADHYTNISY